MKEQLRQFFRIPCEVKDAFWEDAVRKNRVTLLLVSIMIFGMELFNMGRVLFMTESRLGTANNRRYFFMYLTLFLGAVYVWATPERWLAPDAWEQVLRNTFFLI